MAVYIQRSDGAYVKFEGMTSDQITTMLTAQNLTCSFITEEAYNTYAQAQQRQVSHV